MRVFAEGSSRDVLSDTDQSLRDPLLPVGSALALAVSAGASDSLSFTDLTHVPRRAARVRSRLARRHRDDDVPGVLYSTKRSG
jgi:hypothetical protein